MRLARLGALREMLLSKEPFRRLLLLDLLRILCIVGWGWGRGSGLGLGLKKVGNELVVLRSYVARPTLQAIEPLLCRWID